MNISNHVKHFAIGAALLFSAGTLADDIEIYFGAAGGAESGVYRPNVLFVLDTSGSMLDEDATNPPVTRLQRMKDALKQVILSANNINIGLQRFHAQGGPILYPVSYIDADSSVVEGTGGAPTDTITVQPRISQSADDAEQGASGTVLTDANLEIVETATGGGTFTFELPIENPAGDVEEQNPPNNFLSTTSSDLEFMNDGGTLQKIGLRFRNFWDLLPPGATITDARIRFTRHPSGNSNNTSINIRIYAHDVCDAPAFASGSSTNVSGRTKTSTSVDWNNPANISSIQTPNLLNIMQEIVTSCGGWDNVDDMAFLFERVSGSGRRGYYSYDGTSTLSQRPTLIITYNTSPVITSQTVGFRFQNVGVPQGATVTSAVLEFTSSNTNSAATLLAIRGEDSDNSENDFAAQDLTSRPLTDAIFPASGTWASPWTGNWDAHDWTAQNTAYQTTDTTGLLTTDPNYDLRSIVQEIVDRPGWCGGNAMTMLISGTGTRTAWSYDGDPSKAPILRITYDNSPEPTGCNVKTVQKQVNISSDDAEEFQNGSMSLNGTDLELVYDGSTNGNQDIGVRFQNVDIPTGATIQSAYIEFTATGSSSTGSSLTIDGEASDFAQTFQVYAGNVSGRTKTSLANRVTWSALSWSDGQKNKTPSLANIVQEIVDRPGWAPYNGMAFIISGTSTVRRAWSYDGSAANAPVLKVTYTGGTGGVVKTVRQRLIETIDELDYKSWTPIVDALYEASQYYRGASVCFGKTRGLNSVTGGSCQPDNGNDGYPETDDDRSEYTRISHPASWTGGTHYYPPGCTENNLNSTSCINEAITGSPVYKSPITSNCQTNYIVLLSDGEPNSLHSETQVESLTGESCSGSNGGESCAFHLAEYMHANDMMPSATATCPTCNSGDQTITTYTIGFALDGDPDYLEDIADNGGGSFYTADSTQGLVDAFQEIISQILEVPASFTAPALSVNAFNKLFNRNEVYFALFKPSSARGWVGNVKKYLICNGDTDGDGDVDGDGTTCGGTTILGDVLDAEGDPAVDADDKLDDNATSLWSNDVDGSEVESGGALAEAPAYATRAGRLYTYTANSSDSTANFPSAAVTLATAGDTPHRVKTGNSNLTQAMLGATTSTERTNIIEWMQGKDVNDDNNNSITDENRAGIYGDPLHSRPIVITYGKHANGVPVQKLVVGTNDGAVHFVNANGDADTPNPSTGGQEQWAFYAPASLAWQKTLFDNPAGSPEHKIYGVDGTPAVLVIDNDVEGEIDPADGDKVYLYFGMRDGGRDIYALDVTPASLLADPAATTDINPKFMWRIEGGTNKGSVGVKDYDYQGLGFTWSAPHATKIRMTESSTVVTKDVLIFGAGYDGSSQETNQETDADNPNGTPIGTTNTGNGIYIADAVTGKRLLWVSETSFSASIDADLEVPGMNYAIPGDIKLVDSNGDGFTDRLYFSDTGGQIWRMDLATDMQAGNPGSSRAARLASFSDLTSPYTDADKRRLYSRVEATPIRDTYFSTATSSGNVVTDYDVITIISGYNEHPLDLTIADRVYTVRDYLLDGNFPTGSTITTDGGGVPTNYPKCISSGALANCGGPLTESNLVDTTANLIQVGDTGQQATAKTAFGASEGWYIILKESDGSFIGEKGLSPTTVFNGILFFSTYIPSSVAAAEDSCTGAEGTGRLWAVDILSGAAVFPEFDGDPGDLTTTDRYQTVGAGIPTQVVPVVQIPGITLLVGGSAGATNPGVILEHNVRRTHWYQN